MPSEWVVIFHHEHANPRIFRLCRQYVLQEWGLTMARPKRQPWSIRKVVYIPLRRSGSAKLRRLGSIAIHFGRSRSARSVKFSPPASPLNTNLLGNALQCVENYIKDGRVANGTKEAWVSLEKGE